MNKVYLLNPVKIIESTSQVFISLFSLLTSTEKT